MSAATPRAAPRRAGRQPRFWLRPLLEKVAFSATIALSAVGLGALIARGYGEVAAGLTVLGGALLIWVGASATFTAGALTIAAFLQPPLGDIGPVPEVQAAEVLVPLVVAGMVIRSLLRTNQRNGTGEQRETGSRAIHIAVFAFAGVIAWNVVRTNYVLPEQAQGVDRAFFGYAIGLGMYFVVYHYLVVRRVDIDWLLTLILHLSLGVCVVGLGAVVLGLPLDLGDLRYSVYDYATGGVRVGFLEAFGTAGFVLVLLSPMRLRWLAGLLFAAAIIASGGRAALFGTAVAVALYLVLTRRGLVIAVAVAVLGLASMLVPAINQTAQVQRFSRLGSQEFKSDGRTFLFDESLKEFAANPIFGTGVGVPAVVFDPDPDVAKFYETQLEIGGHATYSSLLKNFGLSGFLPFAAALLIALWQLGRRAGESRRAAFFFMMLAAQLVGLTVGGNGSDPGFFFLLAGGSATLAVAARERASIPGGDAERSAGPGLPVPLAAESGQVTY